MRHLPESIKLLGYTIPIRPMQKKNKGKLLGCFVPQETTIYIDFSYSADAQKETLVHEVLHCMVWLLGLQDEFKTMKNEESFITVLSPVLYSILEVLK
jgi:hypothetical protein